MVIEVIYNDDIDDVGFEGSMALSILARLCYARQTNRSLPERFDVPYDDRARNACTWWQGSAFYIDMC
jgi:hypothetical protein